MNDNKVWHGHVAMLIANIIWGLMAPVSKDTLNYFIAHDISRFVLPSFRMLGAAVAFWTLSLFVPHEHTTLSDKKKFFLAGMFSIACNQCLFIVGVSYTSPVDASVVTTMLPIVTMIMAAIVLKEPITHLKVLGVVTGMVGALLLVLSNGRAAAIGGDRPILGDALCFLAQISFSCYLVFFRDFIKRWSGVTLMKWMFLFATIVFVPWQIPSILAIDWAEMPLQVILEICYTVFVATFFSFLLIAIGQKRLRPTVVSSYNYVQPIMSTVVSLWWGQAVFGPVKGIAVALVFLGVYIVTQSKSRQQMLQEQNAK
ncbi:MAG: DMT family transporter [Bacteroidales bacterium]|nr:DMT family transporter [Bacteroidales bacterium]